MELSRGLEIFSRTFVKHFLQKCAILTEKLWEILCLLPAQCVIFIYFLFPSEPPSDVRAATTACLPTSDRLKDCFDQLSSLAQKPNLSCRSFLNPWFFLFLAWMIPGIDLAASYVTHGCHYNFIKHPVYQGPDAYPHLEGDKLATVLEDAIK